MAEAEAEAPTGDARLRLSERSCGCDCGEGGVAKARFSRETDPLGEIMAVEVLGERLGLRMTVERWTGDCLKSCRWLWTEVMGLSWRRRRWVLGEGRPRPRPPLTTLAMMPEVTSGEGGFVLCCCCCCLSADAASAALLRSRREEVRRKAALAAEEGECCGTAKVKLSLCALASFG